MRNEQLFRIHPTAQKSYRELIKLFDLDPAKCLNADLDGPGANRIELYPRERFIMPKGMGEILSRLHGPRAANLPNKGLGYEEKTD